MRVCNGQSQGIGRILTRQGWQLQNAHDHLLHFGLAGLTVACDSFL